jgi:hypothetical protein
MRSNYREVNVVTFSESYAIYGPDTIAISKALNIPEHEADRLINERMERRYRRRAYEARVRFQLREIRERHA